MDHLAMLGVDRTASHRASGEEEIFVSRFDQKPDRDAGLPSGPGFVGEQIRA